MQLITAADLEARLSYPALVDVLAAAFRVGAVAPPRHHHQMARPGQPDATLLLMPAWTGSGRTPGGYFGTKLVTVSPDNGARGRPAVQGVYVLSALATGEPLALIDAPRLTVWRTAAASALASRVLARADATRMLMVGAGALAPYLIRAHASVRPIRHVDIWNRTRAGAERVAADLAANGHTGRLGLTVTVVDDLGAAVRAADLVSTATISSTPVVEGAWLKPGTHVDCVGAFRPDMRETDDEVMRRAGMVYVDTRAGGLTEAGDIVMALASGALTPDRIAGDLFDIAKGTVPGRRRADEITVFKSVGASVEDLAAAIAIFEHA
jgi:ornithine cyclodeaminase